MYSRKKSFFARFFAQKTVNTCHNTKKIIRVNSDTLRVKVFGRQLKTFMVEMNCSAS